MIDYSIAMLENISNFLMSEPIRYLVGLIMLSIVFSLIMMIIRPR